MDAFARDLVAVLSAAPRRLIAWCVLPNHYHALVETPELLRLFHDVGQLHGRTSHAWNGVDHARGRHVFFRAIDRAMRSDAHVYATLNYIHNNPVHHRYVERWTDWPWSSFGEWLAIHGRDEAERLWRAYPMRDYGKGWDDPEL